MTESSKLQSRSDAVRNAMIELQAAIEEIPPKANGFRLLNAYRAVLKEVSRLAAPVSEQQQRMLDDSEVKIVARQAHLPKFMHDTESSRIALATFAYLASRFERDRSPE